MKKIHSTFVICLLAFQVSYAQTSSSGISLVGILLLVAAFILLMALLLLADSVVRVEAKKMGLDSEDEKLGLLPSMKRAFQRKKFPDFAPIENTILLDEGMNINIVGEAEEKWIEDVKVNTYAVQPPNFRGIFPIPKMMVEVGDDVLAGQPLFYDKSNPEIKYVAPVSGEIIDIKRGAKRSIAEVIILADKDQKFKKMDPPSLDKNRDELVAFLVESGAWPLIRQRPYDVIADPTEVPRDIFISTFNTGPNAPDADFVIQGKKEAFHKGISVLSHLTSGHVHLGLNGNKKPSVVFREETNAEHHYFVGKHPVGNVGVHIHHVKPIGKLDKVWTLGIQDVVTIGQLWLEKKFNSERVIAVTGENLKHTGYVKTHIGANIEDLLAGNLEDQEQGYRFISGDVLTGERKEKESFLNVYDQQISIVPEGDDYELFGWISPFKEVPSLSPSLPLGGFEDVEYQVNTNTNGEKRAFVVTGQYEQVMPMDIYPQHLMKAIMTNDIERMEGLGIKELIEEDVALCEYVCTSKMPLQDILRDGLDYLREQE